MSRECPFASDRYRLLSSPFSLAPVQALNALVAAMIRRLINQMGLASLMSDPFVVVAMN
jgi:hypothetical protein